MAEDVTSVCGCVVVVVAVAVAVVVVECVLSSLTVDTDIWNELTKPEFRKETSYYEWYDASFTLLTLR